VFLHFWTPQIRQVMFGSYGVVDYPARSVVTTPVGGTLGFPDTTEWRIGSNLGWLPVSASMLGSRRSIAVSTRAAGCSWTTIPHQGASSTLRLPLKPACGSSGIFESEPRDRVRSYRTFRKFYAKASLRPVHGIADPDLQGRA
jgi:hypothetical protein